MFAGVFFSSNNFIINQFQVVVSDAVLVRCIIQLIIYNTIIYFTKDSLLPKTCKAKLLTISQGKLDSKNLHIITYCSI